MFTGSIMPPAPPSNIKVSIGQNRFEYIKDKYMREMMINGFQAIHRLELWEFMQNDPGEGGFMFCQDPKIGLIADMMDKCEYPPGHSGSSFGCIMRELQYIARFGQEEYKKMILEKDI